jgi:hypothetical protein
MDILTFVSEMAKALAWPVTVLLILLLIRRPLLEYIPFVRRLRYGDLELDFEREVVQLSAKASRALPSSEGARPRLTQTAYISPRAAVLEAWLELEAVAMEASKRHGLALTSREMRSPLELGQALEKAGVLSGEKLEIYHRLRNLRNAAAHATHFAFDPEVAIEYADLADRLVQHLRESKPAGAG